MLSDEAAEEVEVRVVSTSRRLSRQRRTSLCKNNEVS